jgi:hypothetical protein
MSIFKVFSAAIVITLFMVTGVQAKPPFIDYQWSGYEGSQKQCVQRAKITLQEMKFIMSPSTGSQESIGYQGDYKAVIACLPDYEMVVFIVAGPIYKQAELLSKRLKNNF